MGGAEFMDNMIGCFKNFIQKGGAQFLQMKDWSGASFLELLFKMIDKITTVGFNGEDQCDMVSAGSMYIVLLENELGKNEAVVLEILKRVLDILPRLNKKKQTKAVYLSVIAVAMHVNTKCTLEFLHMNNWLNNYFELLLTSQKLLKNELDMMCVLYGLSTLFRFNNGQLPNEILTKGD